MKYIVLFTLISFFVGCDSYKEPLYMHGFVYDKVKKEPIQQIKVKMLIDNQEIFSITDEKGYFKINQFSGGCPKSLTNCVRIEYLNTLCGGGYE